MKLLSAIVSKISKSQKHAHQKARIVKRLAPGDVVQQGDVYIICVERAKVKKLGEPAKNRLLAPGMPDSGHHVVGKGPKLCLPSGIEAAILNELTSGKFINSMQSLVACVVEAGAAWEVTHPKHGKLVMPEGTYIVTGQRSHAEEMRRAQD